MEQMAAGASPFTGPFERARRSYYGRGFMLSGLWCGTAAAAAFRLGPALGFDANRSALVAGVAVLSAGFAAVAWRAPSLLQLARSADRRFSLGERLSTALGEGERAEGLRGIMQAALADDAARHAARLDPRKLQPLLTRPVAGAALALGLAVGVAAWMPARSLPVEASPNVAVDPGVRAAHLEAIADVLRGDADKRGNSYLRAVADAVSQLAKTADRPEAEVQKEMAGLLDHAKLAYGDSAPAWLRGGAPADGPTNLAALAEQAASKPVALPMGGGGEELVPELFSEHDAQRNAAATPMLPGQLRITGDEGDLKLGLADTGGDNASRTGGGEAKQVAAGGSAPALGYAKSDAAVEGAAAKLAGGASQSEAGASRVAGGGTQELDDPARVAAAPIEASEPVLLPPDRYRSGKRLRMQITPPAAATGDDASAEMAAAPGAQDPAAVTRDAPSVRDQAMFARVFTHPEPDRAR